MWNKQVQEVCNQVGVIYLLRKCSEMNKMKSSENSYLMKGMEGDADSNKDGKITLGEMQTYLTENVGRHAAMMSRKQEPQLIGDVNRVLVGR